MMTQDQSTAEKTVDVLIVGAGAAGLSAALSASLGGLDTLIAEKTDTFGGTAARSGGMLWVPMNSFSVADGIQDSREEAKAYVRAAAGEVFNEEIVESYLTNAPRMIEAYRKAFPSMTFVRNDAVADNHPHLPGAKDKGRTLTVPLYDGRELGKHIRHLAPPPGTMTFLGMMIPARELIHFFDMWRSRESFRIVLDRLRGHARDLLTKGRTMRLANGAALVGRMAKAAFDRGVPLWRSTPVKELLVEHGRVVGAVLLRNGKPLTVRARKGVILATGGYAHDFARRTSLAPISRLAEQHHPLAKHGVDGDGLRMAEAVGGKIEDRMFNTISWWPVSEVRGRRGKVEYYPHIFDRTKPGFIMVNNTGRRFERETAIGNDLIRALEASSGNGPIEAWLIADHPAARRFGIGIVRPAPLPVTQHIRSGYLKRAGSLRQLAEKCGIDPDVLEDTVARFNENAAKGVDPDFHRGESGLDKRNGDPSVKPNPSLRALEHGPFYAVKILPGDFSTLAGLRTNGNAQVLDKEGNPIPGLYAAGNDLNTMGGGHSPAGGFTLGPAVTFGYVAAQHMAGGGQATA